jgi:phosphatidate cytidylyltransferase
VSASDDGGFRPHPGDPWHPGWSGDDDPDGDVGAETSTGDEPDAKRSGHKRSRKQRRGSKRGRRRDADAEEGAALAEAFDPRATAFDVEDAIPSDGTPDEDPFEAVLEREGGSSRRRAADEDVPAPAWTVDQEPSSEQAIPVEQPSWVGEATAPAAPIEALEFEENEPDEPGTTTPAVPAFEGDAEDVPATDLVDDVVATADADDTSDEPAIAGTYGVAGPEAYAVLDEGSEREDLDDWAAFVEGEAADAESAVAPGDEIPGIPEITEAAEDLPEQEPKRRRFGRRSRSEEPVIDDGFVGAAHELEPNDVDAKAAAAAEALFGAPTEALAGGDAFDEWIDSEEERPKRGLFRRRGKRAAGPAEAVEEVLPEAESEDLADLQAYAPEAMSEELGDEFALGVPFDGTSMDVADGFPERPAEAPPTPPIDGIDASVFEAMTSEQPVLEDEAGDGLSEDQPEEIEAAEDLDQALAAALEALGAEESAETPADEPGVVDVEPVAEVTAEPGADVDQAPADEPAVIGTTAAEVDADEVTVAGEVSAEEDIEAGRQPAEPDLVESREWEGDPGRVPAGWFADIDEDDVVPPPVVDTPETEWPAAEATVHEAAAAGVPPAGDETVLGEAEVPDLDGPAFEGEPVAAEASAEEADPEGSTPAYEAVGVVLGEPDPVITGEQELEYEDVAFGSGESPLDDIRVPEPGDTDLFDLEAARPEPLPPAPEPPVAPVPEGYESWGEAVEQVLEDTTPADDATYEYEPILQDQPAATDELPAGFERFPGGMERFEISQDELDAELGTGEHRGWVTGAADDLTQDAEFDETIYAGPGTIEHRDLAALIAEAGDEDTQWQAMSAAMPGLETGVLGFEDVADLGQGDDYVAPVRSNLRTRVGTGIVLLALLFGSLFAADFAFVGFVGVMLLLGLAELYAALRRSGYFPMTLFGLLGGAATLVATWFHGPLALPAGVLLTSMVTYFFYAFAPNRRDALANGGLTVLGIGWVIGTVGFVIPIARSEEYIPLVLAVVATTAAMDIGAFSFGRAMGRHPLAPVLSPNKTTEGLTGGVLAALGVSAAFGFLEIGPFDVTGALLLGAVVVALAPLGDLAESMVKRSLGIKDMGSTLPGHGGVLDRIDAFLFVVPAAWALFELAGYLG